MRKHWLFVLAVALQVGIVAMVPARQALSRAFGQTVLLRVEPYDPYDILSGYYVRLRLDIGDRSSLPDGNSVDVEDGDTVFVLLERDTRNIGHVRAVVRELEHAASQPDWLVLRGIWRSGRIDYGIDRFYVPEGKGREIEQALRQHGDEAYAEVKIDASGTAALVRLHVADVIYED